jgi:drug/metabolite transporter (DMT)-like permease
LMQPLTASILAIFLFNEILNVMQITFAVLSMFGIYLARLNISKSEIKQN